MKSQLKIFVAIWAIVLLGKEASAQTIVIPKQEKIEIRGTEGDYTAILQKLDSQKPTLSLDRGSLEQLGKRTIEGSLTFTVKQGGKVVFQSGKVPVTINEQAQSVDLISRGLDETMISTWEKQGFIRRQVGRIDDPDAKTGTLPEPKTPDNGKSGGTAKTTGQTGSKPVDKTSQQGFIRRQVGRIPKSEYEVEVNFTAPNDRGNSQPSTFLVIII